MTLRAYTGSVNLEPYKHSHKFYFFFANMMTVTYIEHSSKFINLCKAQQRINKLDAI